MEAVTVIIPVYNVARYLETCVQSVLAQTFTAYRIVLVDDGSTDESGAICDRLAAEHHCISVIHQQNKGLGGARNTGIDAAAGEYLLFLDSDDSLHPEALARCYRLAQEQDCQMVLFDLVSVYENGTRGVVYGCAPAIPHTRLTGDALKAAAAVSSACNRFCKRTLFTETGIRFPERVWYEDLYTVPKLIPHLTAAYYDDAQPLYYYFQRSASIMHTPDFERLVRERIAAVESVWDYYEAQGLTEAYRDELAFLWIYHAFFLPVREMLATGKAFEPYADTLREALAARCAQPMSNPYMHTLSAKERQLFRWFWGRNYKTVRMLSAIHKLFK